jgi:hypothetical protein
MSRTKDTLEAMQGGRYSADECHPLYVLASELEESEADLIQRVRTLETELNNLKNAGGQP